MKSIKWLTLFALVASGCGGGGGNSEPSTSTPSTVPAPSPAPAAPAPSPAPGPSPSPNPSPSAATKYSLLAPSDFGGLQPMDLNDKGEVLGTGYQSAGLHATGIWTKAGLAIIPDTVDPCLYTCLMGDFINNKSEVILSSMTRQGTFRYYIWRNGVIGSLGCGDVKGLNDSDEAVMADMCVGDAPGPYTYMPGIVKVSNAVQSVIYRNFAPTGINNSGVVIGTERIENSSGGTSLDTRAIQYTSTYQVMYLEDAGFVTSTPWAINDSGIVAGTVNTEHTTTAASIGHPRPSLWKDGVRSTLPCPDVDGQAYDINNGGVVAGSCVRRNGSTYAVLWKDGKATDLNTLLPASAITAGWSLTIAIRLNELGWVIARARKSGDLEDTSVLLVPQ